MNDRKKISRISLLMIASELLIAVFVFRWLQSEYNGEKEQLQKNLSTQFTDARSRMMDSVISKKYIEPILGNPAGFKIRTVNVIGDSSSPGASHMEIYAEDSLKIIDSIHGNLHPKNAKIEVKVLSDTSKDVLYRGVKMFISKVQDEDSTSIFEKHILSVDTTMLKTFFAENLKRSNLPVHVMWISDRNHQNNFQPPPFYYECEFMDKPYGVVVSNYNGFLFEKILPQILFALQLLGVTSAAFIFSFRSLRNQLRLSAMKDDFISNMSHELKTPVATVKVAIEAMQQMDPAEKKEMIKEYLGMASQELTRLDVLITKVMNSIMMDHGKQALNAEAVNMKSLIEQSLKSMELQLQQRNAKVNFISKAENISTHVDSILVQGIFYNLIDNSLKYGKDEPAINIHLSETPSEVIVDFSDNGAGIPEEYIDKVFEKFLRVPTGNQHTVKGYGLGLNYVAQVMKMHHGSVLVKNLPQGGCEFTLKFPGA